MRTLRSKRTMRMGQRAAQAITGGRWFQPGQNLPTAELVINGAFATDTDWTKGTGWTIAGGVAVGAAGSLSALTPTAPVLLTQGNRYRAIFDIVALTAGGVAANVGATIGTLRTTAGHFEEIITAGAASALILDKDAAFAGSVDNFSVREVL